VAQREPVRPELILEGSYDGVHWQAYDFRYKPDAVDERPRFVAPFHPRLDWQLWFAALAPVENLGWLETLAGRLRSGTPEVLALLGRNPFPGEPPRTCGRCCTITGSARPKSVDVRTDGG
jgi:hypothetical protein